MKLVGLGGSTRRNWFSGELWRRDLKYVELEVRRVLWRCHGVELTTITTVESRPARLAL